MTSKFKFTLRRISLADVSGSDTGRLTDDQAHMPNWSRLRQGINVNRRSKSHLLKYLLHIEDVFPDVHLVLFLMMKSTNFFLFFRASGRSSFANGMACRAIPATRLGSFEQPYTTHRLSIFLNQFSSCPLARREASAEGRGPKARGRGC